MKCRIPVMLTAAFVVFEISTVCDAAKSFEVQSTCSALHALSLHLGSSAPGDKGVEKLIAQVQPHVAASLEILKELRSEPGPIRLDTLDHQIQMIEAIADPNIISNLNADGKLKARVAIRATLSHIQIRLDSAVNSLSLHKALMDAVELLNSMARSLSDDTQGQQRGEIVISTQRSVSPTPSFKLR